MEQINEAVEKRAGGTRLKKKGGIGGPLLIALALTAAVGGGAYLGLCAYAVNSDAIWRNTYVLNQDIGGLTADEAVQKTEAALPDLAIGLQLYDVDGGPVDTDSPDSLSASIPLSDLGAEVDAAALVDYADSSVKSGPFLTAGYRYLAASLPRNCTDPSAIRLDPAKTAETAERVAGELSWPALNTEYDVEETALLVRTAMDGRAVDAEDLEETLNGRAWAGTGVISLPCKTLPPARTMTAQDIHDAVSGEVKNAGYDLETNAITPEQAGRTSTYPPPRRPWTRRSPAPPCASPRTSGSPPSQPRTWRSCCSGTCWGRPGPMSAARRPASPT